jgi:predicted alpha/beta-fold hydrolase
LSALSFLLLMGVIVKWAILLILSRKSDVPTAAPQLTKSQIIFNALLLILACELPIFLSTPKEGLVDLIQGTDPLLNEILARVPSLQQGPSPPLLLRNRHIQFIPWLLQNEMHRKQGIPYQRIHVNVSDCVNKIECHAAMNDTVTLDIFPPMDSQEYTGFNKSSPVILYAPGLKCHSQDLPGNSIIRRAYGSGFRSIVVNRRGHTPNQRLKSPRWNLFGDVDDLEQVYWFIKDHLVTQDTAFFLHGISAGTAVTVTALSKWDRRRVVEPERKTPAIVASLDLTPRYDTSKVLLRERFLWPYNDLLMQGVKDHFIVKNEELLRAHDSDAVDRLLNASSLQEIVDVGVIFAGYDNTTHYYEDTNPINALKDILTPKLVVNAVDDVGS